MPYVFALLVVVNAVVLGYFVFLDDPSSGVQPTVVAAKAQLTKEISFANTSANVPPVIGDER